MTERYQLNDGLLIIRETRYCGFAYTYLLNDGQIAGDVGFASRQDAYDAALGRL